MLFGKVRAFAGFNLAGDLAGPAVVFEAVSCDSGQAKKAQSDEDGLMFFVLFFFIIIIINLHTYAIPLE